MAAITLPSKEILLISDLNQRISGYNDVLTPLTQKLYTQEVEAQPDESSEESSDNTVDAEFEEVKEEDK